MIALSRSALAGLPPGVHGPAYDVTKVTPGIVHLGLGGFHRAHMARYTHNLMDRDADALRWGITGAGLMPNDRKMRDVLKAQDGLYTLVERDGADETVTVIGALTDVLFAGETSTRVLAAIDRARIVSTTVTENGYCLNRATKRLDTSHPLIAADLAHPGDPRSVIGIITEAYRRRMVTGAAPFTALCCDNIQHNGDVLRDAVLDFASLRDPALADWISTHARFPNSMVDRITPVTREEDIAALSARHGIADGWPVFCETFTQWVIEDDFADGRPAWEQAGAQFVTDVTPYEFMKLRLLNTSHLAMAALGRLIGYRYIHETMQDETLRRTMIALMDHETGPTLMPVPGIDIAAYKARLVERFANPAIMDTVERVNTDAPLNYLVDPIRDRLKVGDSAELLALALAAWLRRVRGTDEQGEPIDVRHPMAQILRDRAIAGGPDPRPLLEIHELFGEMGRNEGFIASVGKWLTSLYDIGAAKTVALARETLKF
ncbi:MAG TPA: mannitol dehydrogenase family protein [Rhizomicrobium sp.]|jgi:mannitol-1-phosphate/altronate dehydrogenase